MERTLVLLKPSTVMRGLIGEVTSRFEKKGLRIAGMKMLSVMPVFHGFGLGIGIHTALTW